MRLSFWLVVGWIGVAGSAFAQVSAPVLEVTTDARPGKLFFVKVMSDAQGDATGMQVEEGKDVDQYPLAQVRTKVVLYKESNFEVLSLAAPKFSAKNGGVITMRFLKNGIFKSYVDFPIVIERGGAQWQAYTVPAQGKHFIGKMFLRKNTILKQVVGIKAIEVQ